MMSVSLSTCVIVQKYYKGKVDDVKFIYDPKNIISQDVWSFEYDDNDTNDPEYQKHQRLWEQQAMKRIKELVSASEKWEVNGETNDN